MNKIFNDKIKIILFKVTYDIIYLKKVLIKLEEILTCKRLYYHSLLNKFLDISNI